MARRWVLALDCFWLLMLLLAVGTGLTGRLPWYKALVVLAPFSAYLLTRSSILPRAAHSPAAGDQLPLSSTPGIRESRTP